MRKIKITEPVDNKAWEKWKVKCKRETQKLIDKYTPGCQIDIKEQLYKEQKDYYKNETGPFYGKCSYCETEYRHHDDLDHYRPKKIVTDENDVKISHPGYYWLAYLWNNLLPVCKECNSLSIQGGKKIGKQNRFPVKGKHAFAPGEEMNEHPLLLNPTVDSPESHLEWNKEEKLIVAKPGDERGQMTIRILGFHQREQLRENWKRAFEETKRQFWSLMNPDQGDPVQRLKELKAELEEGNVKFSFVALAAFEEMIDSVNSVRNEP